MSDTENNRSTTCQKHSGIVAELDAGRGCMDRLEKVIEELRKNFTDHVNSSSKSTIAMLIGILMCFLSGLVGIYVTTLDSKTKLSNQAEVTMIVEAIKEANECKNH